MNIVEIIEHKNNLNTLRKLMNLSCFYIINKIS